MIPLVLFLLACAAIYVGTVRAAFTAMLRLSLRFLVEQSRQGDPLARYLEDPVLLFVPARLILGLIVVCVAPLLVVQLGERRPGDLGVLAASIVAFVIVCEQVIPQLLVRRNPQAVLQALLPTFHFIATALSPMTRFIVGPVRRERTSTGNGGNGTSAVETNGNAGEETPSEEQSDREERRLLRSIVEFRDRLVREVMTPRPDIVAIPFDATIDEVRALFREEEYSRVAVFKESLDNILGFVFVKDLIKLDEASASGRDAASLMRPAYFVPETKRVPELLKEFQRKQVQSAIVVDEYGGTAGLVTIEDLLEELVGEIRDEYDIETEPIVDEGQGAYLFSGKVKIDDVVDRLGVPLQGEGFETVGGYLLTHVGRVPAVGEAFDIDGLSFEVLEVERRRIKKVRIRKAQALARA